MWRCEPTEAERLSGFSGEEGRREIAAPADPELTLEPTPTGDARASVAGNGGTNADDVDDMAEKRAARSASISWSESLSSSGSSHPPGLGCLEESEAELSPPKTLTARKDVDWRRVCRCGRGAGGSGSTRAR